MAKFAWKGRRDFDAETKADVLAVLRNERDRALRESDWTQLPDVSMTSAERRAWREYRQLLRDLTDTVRPEQDAKDIQEIPLPTRPTTPPQGRHGSGGR